MNDRKNKWMNPGMNKERVNKWMAKTDKWTNGGMNT